MNSLAALRERSLVLFTQGRHDLAMRELRQLLAEHPDDFWGHSMLAMCLARQAKHSEAQESAQMAIGLAPDQAFCHFAQSLTHLCANRIKEAEKSIRLAIELEPDAVSNYSFLAEILLLQSRWKEALAIAEQGLALDPENTKCANTRSEALIKLGRRADAIDELQSALQRDPENANTHANMGWALIEQGRPDEAMTHFREALRLEPDSEFARVGIITALKARNPLYRPILWYFLWMEKIGTRYGVMLVVGLFFLNRFVSELVQNNPGLAPVLNPIQIVYILFVLSTWLGNALFNLVLFTNRLGRLALNTAEKRASLLVGTSLAVAILFFVVSFWLPFFFMSSLGILFATLPFSNLYHVAPGWSRITVLGLASALVVMSLVPLGIILEADYLRVMKHDDASIKSMIAICKYCFTNLAPVALVSQIVTQVLVARNPRRIVD